jgi:uncharacterized protein YecA (UPF0149 family)
MSTETAAYSPDPALTPQQQRIVNKLAEGFSATQAAQAENIHRNTITNWRRTVPAFAREIEFAAREQSSRWHDEVVSLAPLALQAIREILTTPEASPSLKLRASLAILRMAAQPHAEPQAARKIENQIVHTENVHNSAQSCTTPTELGSFVPAAANPENLHKFAQSCTTKPLPVRKAPLPGRNSPCPCGSGGKFKRCCAQTLKFTYYEDAEKGEEAVVA